MGTTAGSGAASVAGQTWTAASLGVKRAPLVLPGAAKIEGGGQGRKHGDRGCGNVARRYAL